MSMRLPAEVEKFEFLNARDVQKVADWVAVVVARIPDPSLAINHERYFFDG